MQSGTGNPTRIRTRNWGIWRSLFSGFRSVCPIHFHFLLLMLSSIQLWCVLPHSYSFEMTSGQQIFKIILKHLLINVCNFLISSFVDLQVSEPYGRTDFTFISICQRKWLTTWLVTTVSNIFQQLFLDDSILLHFIERHDKISITHNVQSL